MKNRALLLLLATLLCVPAAQGQQANSPDANAQNTAALEQHIRDLEDRVIALEGKIRNMESAQAAAVPQAQPPTQTARSGSQPAVQEPAPAPTVPAPNEGPT